MVVIRRHYVLVIWSSASAKRNRTLLPSKHSPFLVSPFRRTVHNECRENISDPEQLTFWQTTHNGSPNASSHSPGPRGRLTSPSDERELPPSKAVPFPLSRHRIMTSSILVLHSGLSETSNTRSSFTQSLNCCNQSHGSDQSSKMTIKVFGIDSGVRSDRKSGVKVGEESANKYMDNRAMVSLLCQLGEGGLGCQ